MDRNTRRAWERTFGKLQKRIPVNIKRVTSSREPVFITQRGRAAAVMVSMEDYENAQHENEILRLLARGEKEIEAGIGYELDEVMKEADKILDGVKS